MSQDKYIFAGIFLVAMIYIGVKILLIRRNDELKVRAMMFPLTKENINGLGLISADYLQTELDKWRPTVSNDFEALEYDKFQHYVQKIRLNQISEHEIGEMNQLICRYTKLIHE